MRFSVLSAPLVPQSIAQALLATLLAWVTWNLPKQANTSFVDGQKAGKQPEIGGASLIFL